MSIENAARCYAVKVDELPSAIVNQMANKIDYYSDGIANHGDDFVLVSKQTMLDICTAIRLTAEKCNELAAEVNMLKSTAHSHAE